MLIKKVKKEFYRFITKFEKNIINLIYKIKSTYLKEFFEYEPYHIQKKLNFIPFDFFGWGDIWKKYYLNNYQCIEQKKELLKNNLSDNCKQMVDMIVERNFFLVPIKKFEKYTLYDKFQIFSQEELTEQTKDLNIVEIKSKYKLSDGSYTKTIFQYKNGLSFIPKKILLTLKNKDFIDGGALMGDSALIFNDYSPNKIYSFEPIKYNYGLLQETIKLNNLESIICPVNIGLSDKEEEIELHGSWGSASVHQISDHHNKVHETISTTTIDKFVKENNLNLGLIKLDIERNELETINGAIESIRKFKPILLISIYHTPKDFFEIKPLIENLNLGYKFMIKKLEPGNLINEIMLIGYVE